MGIPEKMRASYAHNPDYPKGFVCFKCPGCETQHVIPVMQIPGMTDKPGHGPWGWNGRFDLPTFTPSIDVKTGRLAVTDEQFQKLDPERQQEILKSTTRCHTFVTDGKIRFLGDCTHKLAGQTVDLPDIFEATV